MCQKLIFHLCKKGYAYLKLFYNNIQVHSTACYNMLQHSTAFYNILSSITIFNDAMLQEKNATYYIMLQLFE